MQIYLPNHDIIMELHDAILDVSGGLPGVLDINVIDSAVHRPKTYMSYHEDCDLHTVCAVLMDSISRNHAFTEGNKRTGLMTALLTYELNGISLKSSADATDDFERLVLWVVVDTPEIPEIADRLRKLIAIHKSNTASEIADKFKSFFTLFKNGD